MLSLLRVGQSSLGTFGVLRVGQVPFALTLERPWLNNVRSLSCIPEGQYSCRRIQSPKFGDTFEVTNVLGRSEILFHKGNITDDTHGCILVGESFDGPIDHPRVSASAHGFAEFLFVMKDRDQFDLHITSVPNE